MHEGVPLGTSAGGWPSSAEAAAVLDTHPQLSKRLQAWGAEPQQAWGCLAVPILIKYSCAVAKLCNAQANFFPDVKIFSNIPER